jgi:hypothetical protein
MKPKISKFSIGGDIEMFFQNFETEEFISAEGYVLGTKDNPFNYDPSHPYFAVSLDNVAAEFCIPPVTSSEDWEKFLMRGVEYINSLAPVNTRCVASPAANFSPVYLQTDNAKRFGCDPDYCVWIRDINPPPKADDETLRSAGFHVHVGHDVRRKKQLTDLAIIKAMDIHLGLASVILEPANRRKELYGKAGCFRFKKYGVEYRTLSNYFMSSPELRRWVFDNTVHAINFVNNATSELIVPDEEGFRIMETINTSNIDNAYELIDKYNVRLP